MFFATVLTVSGAAHAETYSTGSWAHIEATVLHDLDDHALAPHQIAFVGMRGNSFFGAGPAYHVGFDVSVGATIGDGGFYYQGAILPVGLALGPIGDGSGVVISTGFAMSGATSTLDDAVALPIDLAFELQMGDSARLIANLRGSFIAAADSRQGGSNIPGIDELDAKLAVRIGSGVAGMGGRISEGYFAGIAYREMFEDKYIGITLGFSGDTGVSY